MPMTHVGAFFFFLTPPKIASFSSKAVVEGLTVALPSPSLLASTPIPEAETA